MSSQGAAARSKPHNARVSDKHLRRVRMLLLLGSALVIVIGLGWGVFFAMRAKWVPVGVDVLLVGTGIAAACLTHRGRLKAASVTALGALFFVICGICITMDIPTYTTPRSTHHFLLALGACAYLLFRGESAWLRLGFPIAFFIAFIIFGSSFAGWAESPYLLPADVRVTGTWSNNILSIVTLCLVLHIMQADITARNAMESDLRAAVAQDQFILHFQPQMGEAGEVIGAEALVRWLHPERGMIPPGKFIPVAEESGLILPIGDWVLKKACTQLVAWAQDPATAGLTLAVNVSAHQFRQPDFVAQVMAIVERSGVQPARLKLELTESMLVKDVEDVIGKMSQLQARGVGFSLDDFGTGYSSLSYLKRLPLDQLKIDQSFVRDLLSDPNDMAIARTVVSLGQSLGLSVIAEGVETEGQRNWLSANGCHAFQGYLFSKPLPIAEFEAFTRRRHGDAQAQQPAAAVSAQPA
jgi:EAL domain-containing protein (putative c-di-GMP-specific phosphodiesterase class I)